MARSAMRSALVSGGGGGGVGIGGGGAGVGVWATAATHSPSVIRR
jgi:hypothetical protein